MNTYCKAVIFDLDGTLLDTIQDLAVSMNHALKSFGFAERELSHHVWAVGNGLRKYAERCLPENAVTDDFLDRFVAVMAAHYRTHSSIKTVPYEGIMKLLDFLSDNNIAINILSNKRDDFVKELTLHYFPNHNFACANGELSNVPRKPDPAAALNIATECKVAPADIIFIGDSVYDVKTGKNAGMKTIAVTWGYQPEESLRAENPDFVAHSPDDIIEYIKSLN